MNIRKRIAKFLGYGGYEWPHNGIVDMPIRVIPQVDYFPDANFISVMCYSGGVQVLPGEVGFRDGYRILLAPPNTASTGQEPSSESPSQVTGGSCQ